MNSSGYRKPKVGDILETVGSWSPDFIGKIVYIGDGFIQSVRTGNQAYFPLERGGYNVHWKFAKPVDYKGYLPKWF